MAGGTYDAIVLGAGGMGSAAAFELARRGRRVLGLEQFGFVHDRGSSHGLTRVIRKAYYEHPDYVPLLHHAYEGWYDLEQRSGRHLFTTCGCLSIGTMDGELVPGVFKAAQDHNLAVDYLTFSTLRHHYPEINVGIDDQGALEPGAGFLYVEECVRSFLDAARALGADLRDQEPVVSWKATAAGVEVRTTRDTYAAGRLVVTAGAWAGPLLRGLGLPLTVLRKPLFWFGVRDAAPFRRDRFPIFLAETRLGMHYGFPVLDPCGLKCARHDGGAAVADPARVDRAVTAADEEEVRGFVRAYLPAADGPVRRSLTCLYTVTPDRHFILDQHPEYPQVALAAGFSGHGYKFAPAVGTILADLAEGGATALPISRFRLGRFRPA